MDTQEVSALSNISPFTYAVGVGDEFQMTAQKPMDVDGIKKQALLNAAESEARKRLTRDFVRNHSLDTLGQNIIRQDKLAEYENHLPAIRSRYQSILDDLGGIEGIFGNQGAQPDAGKKKALQEFWNIYNILDAVRDLKIALFNTLSMNDFKASLSKEETEAFTKTVNEILALPTDEKMRRGVNPSIVELSESIKKDVAAQNEEWPQSGHFPYGAFTLTCADKADERVTGFLKNNNIQSTRIETVPLAKRSAGNTLEQMMLAKLSEMNQGWAGIPVWGKTFDASRLEESELITWENADNYHIALPPDKSTQLLLLLLYALEHGYAFASHRELTAEKRQIAEYPFKDTQDLKRHLSPFHRYEKPMFELVMNVDSAIEQYRREAS